MICRNNCANIYIFLDLIIQLLKIYFLHKIRLTVFMKEHRVYDVLAKNIKNMEIKKMDIHD